MAPPAGRRGRDKGNKSKAKQRKEAGRRTTVHDLPEHVFEQILLRLGPRSSPFLVFAAATCKRWCRIVADAGFLARLAATGPPHVGDYRTVDGCSLFVPSSTPLDVDTRRFSLDFLPDSESWELADSRGSLLLLSKKCTCGGIYHYRCDFCPDLIVCDPLMARYQGILWPPDFDGFDRMAVFLANGDDGVSMSNFRIIAPVDETVVLVFTMGSDGGWLIVHSELPDDPDSVTAGLFAGRANGSFYWGVQEDTSMVLVLDEATAVFSLARLPDKVRGPPDQETVCKLIDGEHGVLRAVRLIGNDLKVFARRRHPGCSNDDDDDEWVLENQLGLPEAIAGLPGHGEALVEREEVTIITANAKYILLSTSNETCVFSVELDTMRVNPETYAGKTYPYEFPWPPVLPGVSKEGRR